jgi:hypothetical protein
VAVSCMFGCGQWTVITVAVFDVVSTAHRLTRIRASFLTRCKE